MILRANPIILIDLPFALIFVFFLDFLVFYFDRFRSKSIILIDQKNLKNQNKILENREKIRK